MKKSVCCAFLALTSLIVALPLVSWETDLHCGLTKWLAVKAGFSLADTEKVALAAQSPDEGVLYPAPYAVPLYTCAQADILASRFVQEHHFPSYGPVPAMPAQRAVTHGMSDNGANVWTRKEIGAGFGDLPRERALRSFGASLHPFEDSWSHQGEPGIPSWPCKELLSWGHPDTRGGWWRHDADITALHVPDTVATAERVYAAMVAYLDARPAWRARPAVDWALLEPEVRAFAAAKTKKEKRHWFSSHPEVPLSSCGYRDFVDSISIPSGEALFGFHSSPPLAVVEKASFREQEIPLASCVEDFAKSFLERWIVEQDIEGLTRSVDVELFSRHLGEGKQSKDGQKIRRVDTRAWVHTVFRMWLLGDHGLVNQLGHGIPLEGEEGFEGLQKLTTDVRLYRQYEVLERAIRAPVSGAPFLIQLLPPDESAVPKRFPAARYAVTFQLQHAPHDTIMLLVEERNGQWFVVGMDRLAE